MNLTFLETFLAVVEVGNLNRAAERLNVTQSTVTARLDTLEDALGRRLVVRERKGTRLTRAGFELRPYAEALVNTWDMARRAIDLPPGFSSMFSFACEFDLWLADGRDWLYHHRATFPTIAFEARPGRRAEIANWMRSGLTDAALVTEGLGASGTVTRVFADQRILHVSTTPELPADWQARYVFVDMGNDFRRDHAETFPDNRTPGMTFSVGAWAREHLLEHGGSAYLPERLVHNDVAQRRLFVMQGAPEFRRRIFLVYRDGAEKRFPWLAEAAPDLPAGPQG